MIHSKDITARALAELLLTRAMTFGPPINAMGYALSPGDPFGDEVPRFPGVGHVAVSQERGYRVSLQRIAQPAQVSGTSQPEQVRVEGRWVRDRPSRRACSAGRSSTGPGRDRAVPGWAAGRAAGGCAGR